PPLRRQSDRGLLRPHDQAPAQPRRRPQSQPSTPSDRRLPTPPLSTHPRLRRTPPRRGPQQERDHPLPQALHRPRGLLHPPRRPRRPHPTKYLTSIGTSSSRSSLSRPILTLWPH